MTKNKKPFFEEELRTLIFATIITYVFISSSVLSKEMHDLGEVTGDFVFYFISIILVLMNMAVMYKIMKRSEW